MLVTIVLVAFLVLILVGLATFTRVETQVASNSQAQAQARQHALLALNLALGQLQKHTGPDQRVTAPADASLPSGVPITAATTTTAALASIDTYWSASRNRRWTGAWRQDPATAFDPASPASHRDPLLLSWLVSGNENSPAGDTFTPADTLVGLSPSSSPLDPVLDSSGRPHRILLKTTAAVAAPADLDRLVTAPEITLTSTSVPGTGGAPTPLGRYAWWVGDEGVKARANLLDPYQRDGTTAADRTRFQSAQRPAVETISPDLAPLDPSTHASTSATYAAFTATLGKIVDPAQLPYLDPAPAFASRLKERTHDLTIWSRGVLSDAKSGGLKADLTYLFAQPTLADFRTALRAHYGTVNIAPLNASAADLFANPLLVPEAGPLATLRPAHDGSSYPGRLANTATWEQLWSFANQAASFDGSGRAAPRLHSATQHGAYPLVIQTKVFVRLRIVGGAPDADGANRSGILYVDTIPVVLLANPHAVPLAAADYQFRFSGGNPQLVFGATDSTAAPATDFAARAFTTEPTYAGNLTYVLRSAGMAAGEAQIFTIDPSPGANPTIDPDDRILVLNSNDARQVVMKNDFDPVPALTFNTARSIPATIPDPADSTLTIPATRAALTLGNGGLSTRLYLNYLAAQGDRRLLHFVNSQGTTEGAGFVAGQNRVFVVDPMADGIRQGGGIIAVLHQPPTTDNPAAAPGRASTLFSHQQAPFSQVNYRTLTVNWNAPNSSVSHPLEWSRRFIKNGSTGFPGTAPSPWLAANLLRPSGSTTTARWGIVNLGEGIDQTTPPASIGGASAGAIGFNNHLYDLPRPGLPLSSLGQLQHFNTTGYVPDTGHQANSVMNAWQPNYAVSNSYPQPRVPRDHVYNFVNSASLSLGHHYDGSSLWNDILWDRFHFSTYPQAGSFDFADPADRLVNSRLRPFRPRATVAPDDESAFRGDGSPATAANPRLPAQNLLVEGAFNINSTSLEAWRALFSSLRRIPVGTEPATTNPYGRTFAPATGSTGTETGTAPDSWTGFRDLTDAQIDTLAREMVMQVRKRGPFLSLSDFVNRRLLPAASDTFGLGLSGALQAALDRSVNLTPDIDPAFRVRTSATSSTSATNPNAISFSEVAYIHPHALVGFPGHLLQADLLSALGPTLSARSDTFTIRTYGDSANPATGEVAAQAWCEAVVQRFPDYVDPAADQPHANPAAGTPNATFGRRYQIIAFRWLGPADL